MRAVQITALTGPASLEVVEVDEPAAGAESVIIDVHVAGVAYPQVLQSRGEYFLQPTLPYILGSEVAGTVRSAPADSGLKPGQRVAAFVLVGGFAETVAAPAEMVFALPDEVSFHAGAALPLNYLTAHIALVRRAQLKAGDTVLVHGAAGGVGSAAVQLAGALGARVIAVVSGSDKIDTAKAAGADEVVLADGFLDAVRELTGGRGVDIVVDPVGGDRFPDSVSSLVQDGRLLVVGFTGGEVPQVKVDSLLFHNVSVMGVAWGALWMAQPSFPHEQWSSILPLLRAGKLNPVLGRRFPLEEASQAVLEIDQRRAQGKVLLDVR